MHTTALMLAYLASRGGGRRTDFATELTRGSPVVNAQNPLQIVESTAVLRSHARKNTKGCFAPSRVLARLLLSCKLAHAFNPSRHMPFASSGPAVWNCQHCPSICSRDASVRRRPMRRCCGTFAYMGDADLPPASEQPFLTDTASGFGAFAEETIRVTPGSKTYLVGVNIKQDKYKTLENSWRVTDSLAELQRLAETAGLQVVGSDYQNMQHPSPSTFVGKGKLEELVQLVEEQGIETVIFDEELSVAQSRNVESALGVQVIDRTMLTLFVFAQRARTREAKLQVAAAELRYMLPRLTEFMTTGAGMDAQGGSGGGIFLKGKGETQLEMDRRLVDKQINKIENEIAALQVKREKYLEKRRRKDFLTTIAVVGYTNAGKSTLVNQLTGVNDIYADDLLFATLDPTTRKITLPGGKEVLLSDTVGFIQKLPTKLVASFKATLDELTEATLILHIVDADSPVAVQQVRSVQSIVAEEGCSDIPQVLVLNKWDKLEEKPAVSELVRKIDWKTLHPDVTPNKIVEISALDGDGMDKLLKAIEETLMKLFVKVDCLVPWSEAALLAEVHKTGKMELEEYDESGTHIIAYVPDSLEGRLKKVTTAFKR